MDEIIYENLKRIGSIVKETFQYFIASFVSNLSSYIIVVLTVKTCWDGGLNDSPFVAEHRHRYLPVFR